MVREITRKLEREAEKGKVTPLRFVGIQFPDVAYGKITSKEQLMEQLDLFLRIGAYKPEDDRGCKNNAYFFRGLLKKDLTCTRCHNELQRKECKLKIAGYNHLDNLDYDKIICEKVLCEFYLPDPELEKCKFQYQGIDTYAFLFSHTYLFNIYELCRKARLSVVSDAVDFSFLPIEEQKHVMLEDVKTGLFQALMLDDVTITGNSIFAKMFTIMILK